MGRCKGFFFCGGGGGGGVQIHDNCYLRDSKHCQVFFSSFFFLGGGGEGGNCILIPEGI